MDKKFCTYILNLIELSKQKKKYFADAVGMSYPHFYNVIKGKNLPPPYDECVKLIETISRYVTISPKEKEEILRLAGKERIPDKEKPFIPYIYDPKPIKLEDIDIIANKIPFIPMEKICNIHNTKNLDKCATEYMITHLSYLDLFTTKVKTDEMVCEFYPGEILFIRIEIKHKNNDYVLVLNLATNDSFLRQYKDYGSTKILQPLNSAYKEIFFDDNKYKIIGPVIGKFKSMR